ncbi:hypothetical protein NUW58_g5581 [Xylaria curta]|uniref:Uncharacterized protein n=1 Tax=Xylaria curta TaxID=42375 RepID=A0ACC1P3E7_9PEZI|nr:hypothetical protein NUW58_g5581 [Xylaria curta]
MPGVFSTELSVWQEVNSGVAYTETIHHRLWCQHVGKALGILLFNTGYSYDAQYRSLVFFMQLIAPNLGVFGMHGDTQPWQSFMTDDGSPVELSWDWGTNDGRPAIRYSIEPIGLKAGTSFDPLNLLVGPVLQGQLSKALPNMRLEWLHHFQDFFKVQGNNGCGLADLQDHNTSVFYGFDITDTDTTAKVYFFPKFRAIARNESNLEVLVQAIHSAPYCNEGNLNPLIIFSDFISDTVSADLEYEMLAIDLIDPHESRLKIYFRCRETSFDSVANIMTLGSRLHNPNLQKGLQDLRSLWNAVFTAHGSQPLNQVHHRTAGMLYNVEFRLGDHFPVAKIYLPVRHYSSNDGMVIQGLEKYISSHKRGRYMKAYSNAMTTLFGSETLEAGSGVQTYIGCSIRPDGTLRIVSYFKPPLSSCLNPTNKDGDVIYGVNTNFGGSADLRTSEFVELQRALVRELHYGVLPPGQRDHRTLQNKHHYNLLLDSGYDASFMPWSWARAAIVIRINSLISGCSAVRPVVVERMQDLLQHDIVPMIPLRGSISASGDLSPLSYICGVIQDTAFADIGLEPVMLEAKEGLAITNGTAVSAAAAVLGLYDTHALAILAQILTAMSVEALNGTTESFHDFFSQTRPHPGQTECARNILSFLAGSKLTKVNNGANWALRQDRYSLRTVPQWIGPILEDLVLAHQQISVECNSVTDNPLTTPEGACLHGGNFQAKSVTSAMEKARQATQGIGRMLFSQCTELINPATNRYLLPNLVADNPSVSLIFKGTDLYIAALTAELGFLANPVNHVQTAEMGNQSLNSLALISARYTHTANEVLSQLAALHLIAVCQAIDLRAMHVLFLEVCKPQFTELVAKHCMRPEETMTSSSGFVESFWNELLLSLETTASMELPKRFEVVAKSLRSSALDNPSLSRDSGLVDRLESFTEALSLLLYNTWCANRDAYLAHGDATYLLGRASKVVYIFLRHTLKVPMLASSKIMTPTTQEANSTQAPTVGSYTGAVYRALRDGTLIEAVMGLLLPCK